VDGWKNGGQPINTFPYNLITDAYPTTAEALTEAITEGPYGRCAFACDNDVVDNQTSIMQFENGVTATLKMEAFVKDGGRDIRFFGTEGELELREGENTITLKRYTEANVVWKITDLTDDLVGHGGGDHGIVVELYEYLSRNYVGFCAADIETSVKNHLIGFAAEEARRTDRVVYMADYLQI
jgi:predicted dehydrogenase